MTQSSLNNTIVASFEAHANRTPERTALSFGERSYSFRELNVWANAIAHELRARGVTRNVPVALIFESSLTADRSDAMIAGLLGILKAGGAYVPLQAELSATRLAFMLADINAPVVVCDEPLAEKLGSFADKTLCLDRDQLLLGQGSVENPVPINQAGDIAYIIYTSGSTGTPKGVVVRHDNLLNYTRAIVRMLHADTEPMTFASAGTFSADLGNTAIFPSLSSGGTLRMIGYEAATDGASFAQNVQKHRIDVLKITPSHLSALMTSGDPREMLPGKYLILGGEASSWELIRRIRSVGTCTIINHSPTRCPILSCPLSIRPAFRLDALSTTPKSSSSTRRFIPLPMKWPVSF
jgi:non-ribosomal peptide synthetase component F